MLWPRPRMEPSAATRQAPMGIPPSAAPACISSMAARKPGSLDMVGRGEDEEGGVLDLVLFCLDLFCLVVIGVGRREGDGEMRFWGFFSLNQWMSQKMMICWVWV